MFFIHGTDAPIYHYPIVTTAMLVINVFIHLLVSTTGYDVTPWILVFGDGLHPIQWVTHNFLHGGWIHLIANLIFLFPFGLIVEGKIGWFRMLVLYLAIGAGQGMTQQLLMLHAEPAADALVALIDNPENPLTEEQKDELKAQWRRDLLKEGFGSLGASAVIFGLLAVCVIWAPVNDFYVYFRWGLLISASDGGEREWSVMTVCGIFVAKEFFMLLMMGMPFSSEALRLNGFVVGGAFGLAMLYLGMVDCEGFDLISYLSGTKFKAKRTQKRERRERLAELEAAQPTGPPVAVVPKMAHQISLPHTATATVKSQPLPQPIVPQVVEIPNVPLQPTSNTDADMMADLALPAFDDGTTTVDPQAEARKEIETSIARGNFIRAVRQLAATRKEFREFLVSAASMGRLAEGLIKANQIKPAVTVLTIACRAYPAHEPRWRIRLASLELAVNKDPIAAIKQLRIIDKEMLDTKLRDQYLKLAQHAKRMAGD